MLTTEDNFMMDHSVGGKFIVLERKIGSGSFAELYLGMKISSFSFT